MKKQIVPQAEISKVGTPRRGVRLLGLALCFLCFLLFITSRPSYGQGTTLVRPRQMYLLSNALFTASMATNTNGPVFGTAFRVAVFTNTLIPFNAAHPAGLTVIIGNTNNFAAGSSNFNIAMYAASDTSLVAGAAAGPIGAAYGTNFGMNPIQTWSAPFGCATQSSFTNQYWWTNFPNTLWEPATSLGFTFTNSTLSNITATVILSFPP